MALEVGLLTALAGGVLSVLSPCSALLLPAFLAYAMQSPERALARTGAFVAGLVALLVPLGGGVGALGSLFQANRGLLVAIAGGLLIGLGVLQLLGGGFALGSFAALQQRVRGDSAGGAFVLGLTYAFAGFCSGPILGGVLTVAASSGSAARGAGLLAVYAVGMAVPAIVLAALWDRLGARGRARLRGRPRRIGGLEVHPLRAASGLLFITVGILLVATDGTVALSRAYHGATDVALRASVAVGETVGRIPDVAAGLGLAALAAVGVWWWRRRRRSPAAAPMSEHEPH